jgi:hypothetical protein
MYFPLYPIFKTYCGELYVVNFITFVLSRFRASLLALNHLFLWESTLFAVAQKSSNFLLEIITLVSSANIKGSDEIFIVGGRSLYILWKAKVPGLILGELHALLFPS